MNLREYGWDDAWEQILAAAGPEAGRPARVSCAWRNACGLIAAAGELSAELAGGGRAWPPLARPVAGDWVTLPPMPAGQPPAIGQVLPRRSALLRAAAGEETRVQVLAANVDVAFLVCGLDRDYNLRRLERYLVLVHEARIAPVIVLNKADLHPQPDRYVQETEALAGGVPVLAISAREGVGLDRLAEHLPPGNTGVLLGSSGAGKSTLINALLGQPLQAVGAVRAKDGRGRHTTSVRQLRLLPGGGLLIDSPGLRELRLWGERDGLALTFAEIDELARDCRFKDCAHQGEPGCAVQRAVAEGLIPPERFEHYLRLQRELRHQLGRRDFAAREEERKRWRQISIAQRELKKGRRQ